MFCVVILGCIPRRASFAPKARMTRSIFSKLSRTHLMRESPPEDVSPDTPAFITVAVDPRIFIVRSSSSVKPSPGPRP